MIKVQASTISQISKKKEEVEQSSQKIIIGQNQTSALTADEAFKEAKGKFVKAGLGVGIISALALILGIIKKGAAFPAQALKIAGDLFGSFATLSAPIALITNEINNHKQFTGQLCANNNNKNTFDKIREVFYRCCSLGFTPFIFEPFINPEKLGKSIFHKLATFANIPNLIFTGFSWGIGNFQALLAWGLKEKELNSFTKKADEARANGFDRIYSSAKRLATIGSIANPTMQGLRQAADSLALIFGQMSAGEFFQRPLLGASRLVSLFVGIPEFFIKGIDSFVRVLDERKHLQPVLPEVLNKVIDNTANLIDPQINTEGKTLLKSIRHKAEILFHTLSPLSMFALFTPMIDEPHISEEAQSRGGISALLDKVLGRTGKILTYIFTGSYVLFARLPQTLMQSVFYINKKFYKKQTDAELKDILHNKLANNPIIDGISKISRKCIDFLVENYYKVDHKHNYLNFEQVVADESFAQAREKYKTQIETKNISSELEQKIIQDCIQFVDVDARKHYHTLTQDEKNSITKELKNKIQNIINPLQDSLKPKLKPRFPGAYFLATYIFRLLDIKERILNTDYRSDYRNMKTVYKREELDLSFEGELYPVLTECVQGLRRTVNLVQGITS